MGMNLTKARATKMTRELEQQQLKNRDMLNRTRVYLESAKGGDASAIVPVVKALKDSQQALREAEKALDKAMARKGW